MPITTLSQGNTPSGGQAAPGPNYYVPIPVTGTTPGKLGDRAVDPDTNRTIYYTGDGVSSHSWGFNELVAYPPTMNQ